MPSSSSQHPGYMHGPWLHAQPVAANDAAWRAWGTQDLEVLTQTLVELVRVDAALQAALSEVALSVAAPQDMLQPSSPCTISCNSNIAGCPVKVSSSYIRDSGCGMLSPALILELQAPVPSFKPTASPRVVMQQPVSPRSWKDAASPDLREAAKNGVKMSVVCPDNTADLLGHESAHEQSATLTMHLAPGGRTLQDDVLRARSILSAIPCIATLLELAPGPQQQGDACGPDVHDNSDGQAMSTGRVLLQNEASLSYWGRLDCEKPTGAMDLLTTLFHEEPDAVQKLMRHVQEQPNVMSHQQALDSSWKKQAQVPRSVSSNRGADAVEHSSISRGEAVPGDLGAAQTRGVGPDALRLSSATRASSRQSSAFSEVVQLQTRARSPSVASTSGCLPAASSPNQAWSISPAGQPVAFAPSSSRRTSPLFLLGAAQPRADTGSSTSRGFQPPDHYTRESSLDMDLDHNPYEGSPDPYDHHDNASPGTEAGEVHRQSSLGWHKAQEGPYRRCSQPLLPAEAMAECYSSSVGRHNSSASRVSLSFPLCPGETVTPSVTNRVMMLSLLTAAAPVSGPAELRQRSTIELTQQQSNSLSNSSRRIVSMGCVDMQPQGPKGPQGICSSSITPGRQHSGRPALGTKVSGPLTCIKLTDARAHGRSEDLCSKQQRSVPSSPEESPCPSTPQLTADSLSSLGARSQASASNVEQLALLCKDELKPAPADQQAKQAEGQTQQMPHEQRQRPQQAVNGSGDSIRCRPDALRSVAVEELHAGAAEEGSADDLATHEVEAFIVVDPVTGKPALLILQTDITARAAVEKRMSALTETQLTMLENMLPRQVLEYAICGAGPVGSLAFEHEEVTILFMDIVGFTSMSKEVQPQLVMEFLNRLFSRLDELCEMYDVYKVDTAGDSYIVAGALMTVDEAGFMALNEEPDPRQGARNVVGFAEEIMHLMETFPMPHDGRPTLVRIGIHTGSVVSGVVGTKMFKFSLFGDTMNTSSRMESTSKPGCIQVSRETYDILDEDQQRLFKPTGGVEVKGKGLMATYIFSPESLSQPMPDLRLGAINEEGNLEHIDRSSVQSTDSHLADSAARGSGMSYAPPAPSPMQAGATKTLLQHTLHLESHDVGKVRRFSAQSNCPGPRPKSAAALSSSSLGGHPTRRSYCAAYADGGERRPDCLFADMFLAAAAAIVQQPPQHQDGALLKLIKSNAKPLVKSHEANQS